MEKPFKHRRPLNFPLRAEASLRDVLRDATAEVHQRLHRHPGFAAVASGRISLCEYRDLMCRLFGFYAPFEAAAALPPDRSRRLERDLGDLGVSSEFIVAFPRCADLPALETAQQRLGARYVVEGAALGGQILARGLDDLLGPSAAGRRFFLGRGPKTGPAWTAFLTTLNALPSEAHGQAIAAATGTFEAFEAWMHGWRRTP